MTRRTVTITLTLVEEQSDDEPPPSFDFDVEGEELTRALVKPSLARCGAQVELVRRRAAK